MPFVSHMLSEEYRRDERREKSGLVAQTTLTCMWAQSILSSSLTAFFKHAMGHQSHRFRQCSLVRILKWMAQASAKGDAIPNAHYWQLPCSNYRWKYFDSRVRESAEAIVALAFLAIKKTSQDLAIEETARRLFLLSDYSGDPSPQKANA